MPTSGLQRVGSSFSPYAQSPIAEDPSSLGAIPSFSSRLLSTREFQRIYLGHSEPAPSSHASSPQRQPNASDATGQSPRARRVKVKQKTNSHACKRHSFPEWQDVRKNSSHPRGAQVALVYNSAAHPTSVTPSRRAPLGQQHPKLPSSPQRVPAVLQVAGLSERLRAEVRGTRSISQSSLAPPTGSGDSQWLAVTRALQEKKEEVLSLKKALRRAEVAMLHYISTASAPRGAKVEPTQGAGEDRDPLSVGSLKRRVCFLEEKLTSTMLQVDALHRDARASRVRVLELEVKALRAELKQAARRASRSVSPAARVLPRAAASVNPALSATLDTVEETNSLDEEQETELTAAIRDHRENHELRCRVESLTEEYTSAHLQALQTQALMDQVTYENATLAKELEVLRKLPQEVARLHEQIEQLRPRLIESERELMQFRQVAPSPTTLQRILVEREQLLELLRQKTEVEVTLRSTMDNEKSSAVQVAEKRIITYLEREQGLTADRETQLLATQEKLLARVKHLERLLGKQRRELLSEIEAVKLDKEEDLVQRLLTSFTPISSAAQTPPLMQLLTSCQDRDLSTSRSTSMPRPELPITGCVPLAATITASSLSSATAADSRPSASPLVPTSSLSSSVTSEREPTSSSSTSTDSIIEVPVENAVEVSTTRPDSLEKRHGDTSLMEESLSEESDPSVLQPPVVLVSDEQPMTSTSAFVSSVLAVVPPSTRAEETAPLQVAVPASLASLHPGMVPMATVLLTPTAHEALPSPPVVSTATVLTSTPAGAAAPAVEVTPAPKVCDRTLPDTESLARTAVSAPTVTSQTTDVPSLATSPYPLGPLELFPSPSLANAPSNSKNAPVVVSPATSSIGYQVSSTSTGLPPVLSITPDNPPAETRITTVDMGGDSGNRSSPTSVASSCSEPGSKPVAPKSVELQHVPPAAPVLSAVKTVSSSLVAAAHGPIPLPTKGVSPLPATEPKRSLEKLVPHPTPLMGDEQYSYSISDNVNGHGYSANASIDFVGALSERRRLQEEALMRMQCATGPPSTLVTVEPPAASDAGAPQVNSNAAIAHPYVPNDVLDGGPTRASPTLQIEVPPAVSGSSAMKNLASGAAVVEPSISTPIPQTLIPLVSVSGGDLSLEFPPSAVRPLTVPVSTAVPSASLLASPPVDLHARQSAAVAATKSDVHSPGNPPASLEGAGVPTPSPMVSVPSPPAATVPLQPAAVVPGAVPATLTKEGEIRFSPEAAPETLLPGASAAVPGVEESQRFPLLLATEPPPPPSTAEVTMQLNATVELSDMDSEVKISVDTKQPDASSAPTAMAPPPPPPPAANVPLPPPHTHGTREHGDSAGTSDKSASLLNSGSLRTTTSVASGAVPVVGIGSPQRSLSSSAEGAVLATALTAADAGEVHDDVPGDDLSSLGGEIGALF